jgi:hypothetical protein
MTKRNFELIASVLRSARGDIADGLPAEVVVGRIADNFADELQGTNPRFDRDRFLRACGVES